MHRFSLFALITTTLGMIDSAEVQSSPQVEITPLTERIIALTIEPQSVAKGIRGHYVPQPNDRLISGSRTAPAWTPAGLFEIPKETRLQRGDGDLAQDYGQIYYPAPSFHPHLWTERIEGEPLSIDRFIEPRSYRLTEVEDGDASGSTEVVTVHRKATLHDDHDITGAKLLRHWFYLVLSEPMREGIRYRLAIEGGETLDFTYNPNVTIHEAIHVNQIGYRADDPFKRAFVSLWLGTGGALDIAGIERFEIIDALTGATVYSGQPAGLFPADRVEDFSTQRNFVGTDVLYLDFHDFIQPGNFRIYIPGWGVSRLIRIGENTWAKAFRTAMHGFLSHRSGIELGPPLSRYLRSRNMHPEDGARVFEIRYTILEGESDIVASGIRERLASEPDTTTWQALPHAWGGYMDAGDWDRRSLHLSASRDLIELFSLNPSFFEDFKLNLPGQETDDGIPDLLNEVAWNLAFYRRMQMPDGGVRGGIESTEHPRPGEASWEESLVLGAFAPDPYSSYSYAAAAALFAAALGPYDPRDAQDYAESAVHAWQWAEHNSDRVLQEALARSTESSEPIAKPFNINRATSLIARMRFVAASALFELTSNQKYHEAFLELLESASTDSEELGVYFRYARMSQEFTQPDARRLARGRILEAAGRALAFGDGNAFGLHSPSPGLPVIGYSGFYSVPEMVAGPALPRAYALTGDTRYLRGALHAAHFSAGANPLNRTFTTGVGDDFPRNPLHIDSRVTGQPAPDGITIYGPSDPAADLNFTEWAHRWHLTDMIPASRSWPAAEWHVDMFRWPAMSEYTIHQTFRPVAYYWGFLASRKFATASGQAGT